MELQQKNESEPLTAGNPLEANTKSYGKERYDNLDGLRTIACLGIIAMHIQANARYDLGTAGNTIVSSWTHFVPLFLMISGFGMFCGYYDRFRDGTVSIKQFYDRRYQKILPFFITLILIDIVLSHNLSHLIEGNTEATLTFGLLPNNQPEVVGVCWTLGVIFLFYMLFPFVVYLLWTKRKAWYVFCGSILISCFCSFYYFTDKFVVEGFAARHNILYCAPYLVWGVLPISTEKKSGPLYSTLGGYGCLAASV